MGSRIRPLLALLGLVLTAVLMCGCPTTPKTEGQHAPDWQEARLVLQDSRDIAEGFRPVAVERDREEELERVVDLIDKALAAVDARIEEGGDESGAVEAVRLVLDVSGAVIAEWPNPQERAVASAVHAATRIALRAAHRRLTD